MHRPGRFFSSRASPPGDPIETFGNPRASSPTRNAAHDEIYSLLSTLPPAQQLSFTNTHILPSIKPSREKVILEHLERYIRENPADGGEGDVRKYDFTLEARAFDGEMRGFMKQKDVYKSDAYDDAETIGETIVRWVERLWRIGVDEGVQREDVHKALLKAAEMHDSLVLNEGDFIYELEEDWTEYVLIKRPLQCKRKNREIVKTWKGNGIKGFLAIIWRDLFLAALASEETDTWVDGAVKDVLKVLAARRRGGREIPERRLDVDEEESYWSEEMRAQLPKLKVMVLGDDGKETGIKRKAGNILDGGIKVGESARRRRK